MSQPVIDTLRRWEHHGATWRTAFITNQEAVVHLCTCFGELVEELRTTDADVLRFLRGHPRSDV